MTSIGIYCDVLTIAENTGSITAKGGTATYSDGLSANSITINGGTVRASGLYGGIGARENLIIGSGIVLVEAEGTEYAIIPSKFTTEVTGLGWKTAEGDPETIEKQEEADWNRDYKKVRFHGHDFTWSAKGATITGTCGNEGCGLEGKKVTLTIHAPKDSVYNGEEPAPATLDAEELKRAKAEPEKYGNLIVRVGGFSARFVNLDPGTQADMLSRAMY